MQVKQEQLHSHLWSQQQLHLQGLAQQVCWHRVPGNLCSGAAKNWEQKEDRGCSSAAAAAASRS